MRPPRICTRTPLPGPVRMVAIDPKCAVGRKSRGKGKSEFVHVDVPAGKLDAGNERIRSNNRIESTIPTTEKKRATFNSCFVCVCIMSPVPAEQFVANAVFSITIHQHLKNARGCRVCPSDSPKKGYEAVMCFE